MNNNRDTNPELDYFELRRRHEEYKSRQRMTEASENESGEAAQPVADSNNARQSKNIPDDGASRRAEDLNIPDDEYADEDYYGEDYDPAYDAPEEDVNPFKTLFKLAKGAKNKLSGKRSRSPEYDDGDYAEGDYNEGDYADGEPLDEGEPAAKKRPFFGRKKPEFDEGEYDDLPQDEGEIEDISDDASAYAANGEYAEGDYADDYEDDYEDDYDEEYADEPSKGGGFKRFLNMFVVRVDGSDGEEGDYYDDEYYEDEYEGEVYEDEPAEADDSVSIEPRPRRAGGRHAPSVIEGGQDMNNTNKAASENAKPMAEALETSGMSRRERRELAMRKAAEEAAIQAQLEAKRTAEAERVAAEKAAREAAEKAESTVSVENAPAVYEAPVQAAPAAEKPLDMAAFSDATDDSIIVNAEDVPADSGIDSDDIVVEEPTREFKPVSVRSVADSVDDDEIDLFSVNDEDDDDEDDEEEEEEERPAKRRSLFGRRKKVVEDNEEDYDDDDDYDNDDEDDDEEEDRPAKRRGLFGLRKKVDDDEDADDDEDDDYDDEYEDDEDEYDDEDEDDYDDEDDFDDEDDKRSFGHHLIGVFKTILAIILTLLVVVIVLNVLYLTGNGGFVNKLHDRFGDSSAFNFLFFSYGMRTEESADLPAETSLVDAIDSLPTEAPVEAEPEVSIPDLDDNTVANDFDFDTPDEGANDAVPSVETLPSVESVPSVEAADGNVG